MSVRGSSFELDPRQFDAQLFICDSGTLEAPFISLCAHRESTGEVARRYPEFSDSARLFVSEGRNSLSKTSLHGK